ncbi:MAG: integrase [Stackebrandtia sp.]
MRVSGISTPTRPFKDNEDWLGSAPGMVVVLDGCGVSDALASEVDRRCVHGLPWFVKTLGTALLRSGSDPATPLDDALATAIAETAAAHHGRCDLTHPETPASTVAALRVNRKSMEYLVLSDSTLVVDDGGDEPIVVVDPLDSRITLPSYGDARPGDPEYLDVGRERRRRLAELRNLPDGFPIAAADPQAAYRAVTGHLGLNQVRRALLATDGVTRLVDLFEQMTWSQLVDLAETAGPEEVVARTRAIEESDLDCRRWPRGKVHDDATLALCLF